VNVPYKLLIAGLAAVLVSSCSNSAALNVPQTAGGASSAASSTTHNAVANPNAAALQQSWRQAISHTPTPGNGCYKATYPVTAWIKTDCVEAPNRPYIPRSSAGGSQTVGDGNDFAAVTATLTSNAVGSFPKVKHVTSETDDGKQNVYSLQLNSNFISGDEACAGAYNPSSCLGWLQYVYSSSEHAGFMQYWLIRYTGGTVHCPSGWNSYTPDCYKNSQAVSVPQEPITDLKDITLTGNAVSGGLDTLTFVDGANAYTTTGEDSVMYLSAGWSASEFNVIGDGGGSQADFNTGAALTVQIDVTDGTTNAPTCQPHDGTTGETNNLDLKTCKVAGGASPKVTFQEALKK
jgi:hypothetical protein